MRQKIIHVYVHVVPLVFFPPVVFLGEVHQVDDRLGRQEQVFVENFNLRWGESVSQGFPPSLPL